MSSTILHPPAHLSPRVALQLSQEAPSILRSPAPIAPSISDPISLLNSLFTTAETADLWTSYENLLLSCLRTGDEASAEQCLQRLTARFGADNERILALSGIFQEAVAKDDAELDMILKSYQGILHNDPGNAPITKRRIALLRSLGRNKEAIDSLNSYLEMSPTDGEAWSELGELYASQGCYTQAIFSLEEVLLITPNAWNMNARLGEIQYIAATTVNASSPGESTRLLIESLKRFCRSVELCDNYLRGYYGLKKACSRKRAVFTFSADTLQTSSKLLTNTTTSKHSKSEETTEMPDVTTLQSLNQKATEKLTEIVRNFSKQSYDWQGYDRAEVIAAKALLDKDSSKVIH